LRQIQEDYEEAYERNVRAAQEQWEEEMEKRITEE
jgi:hypothetical protein